MYTPGYYDTIKRTVMTPTRVYFYKKVGGVNLKKLVKVIQLYATYTSSKTLVQNRTLIK